MEAWQKDHQRETISMKSIAFVLILAATPAFSQAPTTVRTHDHKILKRLFVVAAAVGAGFAVNRAAQPSSTIGKLPARPVIPVGPQR